MLTIKNRVGRALAACARIASSWHTVAALIALLALLAGCTPSGPRALRQGQRLMEAGRYKEAVSKLQTATVLLGGTNAQSFNELGLAYHHAGDLAEADKAYRRALALNRDLSEARFNLGCLLLDQDKLEAAKNEFTAYTLHRQNAPEGYLKLGSVQLRTRDALGAERSYSEALRLNPHSAEALNGLGLARLARGRPADAARCFDNALKQQPHYAPALLNLAIVAQLHLRDRSLALEMYKEYVALKPPPPNAEALLATIRQLEQELAPPVRRTTTNAPPAPKAAAAQPKPAPVPTAQNNAAPAPAAPPKAVVAAAPKGAVTNIPKPAPPPARPPATNVQVVKLAPEPAVKQGRPVELAPPPKLPPPEQPLVVTSSAPTVASEPQPAKRSFFQRINPVNLFRSQKSPIRTTPLEPASSTSASAATRTMTPEPDSHTAVASTRPAASPPSAYVYKSPTQPASGNRSEAQRYFTQGLQAYQARRLPQAIQAYQQAIQVDPTLFEAHYNLGLAAAEAGNLPLALNAYETALTVQPNSPDARYNFALVLKQANHLADAAKELERLLAEHPNEVRAHLALANLYAQQMNQPAKARPHYLKVLELAPGHPQVSAIQFWLAANPP